jgi:hypothetical protein
MACARCRNLDLQLNQLERVYIDKLRTLHANIHVSSRAEYDRLQAAESTARGDLQLTRDELRRHKESHLEGEPSSKKISSPGIDSMKRTLRVLTSLTEKRDPERADVDELRWIAPERADAPLDELACYVLQKALKDRADGRKALHNE